MSARRASLLLGAALSASLISSPVAAQSLLAAGGLGIPMQTVDARGRALGSVGPGLFGASVLPADPGAAVDLSIPTSSFTFESSWLAIDQGTGTTTDDQGSRLPAMGVSYPVRKWGVLTASYGGVLDQRWTLRRQHLLPLNAGGGVSVTDEFVSDGGVSAARLGFARRLTRNVGVGAAFGVHTGNVVRAYTRTFDSLAVGGVPIKPFASGGRWSYSGFTGVAALVFDFGSVLRAAGTVSWSGDLEAEPIAGNVSEGKTYDMPLEVRAGISGELAPGLSAVVSASYADWSGTTDDLDRATADGSAAGLGAGLEWGTPSLFGRPLPVRVGWHRAELPFGLEAQNAVETYFAGGVGMHLARAGAIPLAAIDLAVERGTRTAGSFNEDYWRSTLSLRLSGF